jgi:hypothetical protein
MENNSFEFEGKYVVVPRPNAATISADKMNVVYRGVVNPMSISLFLMAMFLLLRQDLLRWGTVTTYEPGGGTEVVISVSGKMSDGKVATDKSIQNKRYSGPTGTIRGETGVVKDLIEFRDCYDWC